eukprot:357380-Chlamydomonas_euryale.AAC.1
MQRRPAKAVNRLDVTPPSAAVAAARARWTLRRVFEQLVQRAHTPTACRVVQRCHAHGVALPAVGAWQWNPPSHRA